MAALNTNLRLSDGIFVKIPCFSPMLSLDCGQAFRWSLLGDGTVRGIAMGKALTIRECDGGVLFCGVSEDEFKQWSDYFDLERDYEAICEGFRADECLRRAVNCCYGIRVLRQEPWEALCSFIISQNNNIPRIKGIIDRLCRQIGDNIGGDDFAFPSPEAVLAAGIKGLEPIRAGFRAKYIIDAAQKVCSGEVDLEKARLLPLDEAQDELMKIKGVGVKVAQCALLYGLGRIEAFPVDVWVKRVMAEMYPQGLPECTRGYEGIAQQYLFHWRRHAQ